MKLSSLALPVAGLPQSSARNPGDGATPGDASDFDALLGELVTDAGSDASLPAAVAITGGATPSPSPAARSAPIAAAGAVLQPVTPDAPGATALAKGRMDAADVLTLASRAAGPADRMPSRQIASSDDRPREGVALAVEADLSPASLPARPSVAEGKAGRGADRKRPEPDVEAEVTGIVPAVAAPLVLQASLSVASALPSNPAPPSAPSQVCATAIIATAGVPKPPTSKTDEGAIAGNQPSQADASLAVPVATTLDPAPAIPSPAPRGATPMPDRPDIATIGSGRPGPAAVIAPPAPGSATLATSVESRIVPDSVRLETHLGFGQRIDAGRPGSPPSAHAGTSDGFLPSTSTSTPGVTAPSSPTAASTPSAAPTPGALPTPPAVATSDVPPSDDDRPSSPNSGAGGITDAPLRPDATASRDTGTPDKPVAASVAAPAAVPSFAATIPVVAVVGQVSDGIVAIASSPSGADVDPSSPRVAPARTMALQLTPPGLGTVSLRLHVTGQALDVHLEVSDGRLAAMIERERDTLSDALRGKDYQLQSLSVTTHDSTMPGATHAERGPDTASADARPQGQFRDGGDTSGNGSGGRAGGGASRDESGSGSSAPRRPMEDAVVERGGASLFV